MNPSKFILFCLAGSLLRSHQRNTRCLGHFVQALLVRKLLWERVSSEQIASVMSGRGTEETKQMFLGGIEMVARGGEDRNEQESPGSGMIETWKRVQVAPGVELHLRGDRKRLKPAELKQLLERLETALRRGV